MDYRRGQKGWGGSDLMARCRRQGGLALLEFYISVSNLYVCVLNMNSFVLHHQNYFSFIFICDGKWQMKKTMLLELTEQVNVTWKFLQCLWQPDRTLKQYSHTQWTHCLTFNVTLVNFCITFPWQATGQLNVQVHYSLLNKRTCHQHFWIASFNKYN